MINQMTTYLDSIMMLHLQFAAAKFFKLLESLNPIFMWEYLLVTQFKTI